MSLRPSEESAVRLVIAPCGTYALQVQRKVRRPNRMWGWEWFSVPTIDLRAPSPAEVPR